MIVVALILVGVVNWIIPEKANMDAKVLYAIEGEQSENMNSLLMLLQSSEGSKRLDSKSQVLELMKEDKDTVGVVVREITGKPAIEIVMQGYENQQSRNALALSLSMALEIQDIDFSNIENVTLQAAKQPEIALNKSFVPLIILNEPVMLGFIFLATLIFMEKEENTIKAYLVSPLRVSEYLLSKIIVMVVLGLISTILITVFTVGVNINWIMLLAIVIAGSTFGATAAMFIAGFFDNLSKAMIWIISISLVFTIPMVAYFVPSFSPWFITVLPTYDLMFAIREAIYPVGNPQIFYQSFMTLIVISGVLYLMCIVLYQKSMLKD
jgi:ABC-type Na+ efflux pump permease subunit